MRKGISSNFRFISISIVLHLSVFACLYYFAVDKNANFEKTDSPSQLTSYIVVKQTKPVIPQVINEDKENVTNSEQANISLPASNENIEEAKSSESVVPEVKEELTTTENIKQDEEFASETQTPVTNTKLENTDGDAPSVTPVPRQNVRALVRQGLLKHNTEKNDQLIEKAAKEILQEHKEELTRGPIFTEEYLQQRRNNNVQTDCNNKLKRGLAILSNFTGGRIECHKNPDFQQFIDARLAVKSPIQNTASDPQNPNSNSAQKNSESK